MTKRERAESIFFFFSPDFALIVIAHTLIPPGYMDEPWFFLRIKIHVLLNRSCYLGGGGGESTSGRFAGLEFGFFSSGLGFGIVTGSISRCSSGMKKKKKRSPLLAAY